MDREYLNDLQEWLKWYNWHRSMIPNMPIDRKVDFLMKANYGSVKLLAGLTDQLIAVEQGKKARESALVLPMWMRR